MRLFHPNHVPDLDQRTLELQPCWSHHLHSVVLLGARMDGCLGAKQNITQQTLMKTNFPLTSPFCLHSRNVKQAVQKRSKPYQNKLGFIPTVSLVPSIKNQLRQEHLLHSEGLIIIICAPQHSSHDPFPQNYYQCITLQPEGVCKTPSNLGFYKIPLHPWHGQRQGQPLCPELKWGYVRCPRGLQGR